jgi:protein phosphatase 1 regulatory subunit 21
LTVCESKLSAAEQAKEHWMLESQLIQVKLERELKKVVELETKLQSIEGTAQQSLQTSTSTPSGSQRSIEICTDFAGSSLQSPTASEDKISLNSNTGAEEEMPQVTAYLRNRISQLIDNLHTSDSKAVAFHAECVSLQQRLTISDKERKKFEEDVDNNRKTIFELREELATNVSNYESQLSLMSEHLANMNDKLTQQKDEIDSLKINNNIKVSFILN